MANNLGMDIQLGENKLTYKMIGGVIELYFFLGPSVDDVVKQYQSIVGLPNLPPYWSLGYHQSRWGYSNVSELRNVLRQFQENHLPVDVIWSDIDYMDQYKVFTTDPVSFPAPSLAEFVEVYFIFFSSSLLASLSPPVSFHSFSQRKGVFLNIFNSIHIYDIGK